MALTLMIVMLAIFGTWTSETKSLTLQEASMVERYEQWMAQYDRKYTDDVEKESRFKIFKENAEFVEKVNNEGNRTYKLSLNAFADLTNEEFIASRTGYKITNQSRSTNSGPSSFRYESLTDIPMTVDWREQEAVTPIKDQGQCGCCWAFSAVAAIEGITKIKTGKLISLSEQQLLDCSTNYNSGCNGGLMDYAFQYIIQNKGLTTETNYPYEAMNGTCNAEKASQSEAQISNFEDVPSKSEEALLKAVANQPVSVAIDIDGALQYYSSGVFNGKCGNNLNHGVTVIGYGTTEDGTKYWLVKNSWGESWGENGYVRIQRDVDAPEGLCGIAIEASYPVVA